MRTITVEAIDQEHEVSPWLWLFPEWVESFFCRCTAESAVKGLLCHLGGARRSSHTGSSSDFH